MQQCTVTELQEALATHANDPSIAFIDVRTPEEHERIHIKGVQLVPLDSLFGAIDTLRDKKKIYVHCRTGNRSLQAVEALRELGVHAELVNVEGGLQMWMGMGLPLVIKK